MLEREAQAWYKTAFGAHYPLLYQHRDEAEARRCLELLPRLAPLRGEAKDLILDLGCGDGRHAAWLQQNEAPVVALDLSSDLLAVAARRELVHPLRLVRGDMRALPFANASFGAVLSLFTAFGYFDSRSANAQPVQEIGRVLARGGRWFLDYFNSDLILAELGDGQPRPKERTIDCLQVSEVRRYDGVKKQVTKEVRLRSVVGREDDALRVGVGPDGLSYTEQVQVFSLPELDAMAAGSGLTRVASAGNYDGAPLGEGNRWLLVYQKKA